MKKTLLTAVSAFAIMAAVPAVAADNATNHQADTTISDDVSNAWDETKEGVSDAADAVSDAAKDTYKGAKSAINKGADKIAAKLDASGEAQIGGLLGEPVYNSNGDRVAKISDVILDENGNATMVILADGDFTGLGKEIALDYDVITTRNQNGDVVAALNEDMIDNAASFSYDTDAAGDDVRVIPANGYSAVALMDSQLVDPAGESLANVDNIVFRNGKADQIIVSFGKMLGLGGAQAALDYDEADLERQSDNTVDFKLTKNQSDEFKQFKKSALN